MSDCLALTIPIEPIFFQNSRLSELCVAIRSPSFIFLKLCLLFLTTSLKAFRFSIKSFLRECASGYGSLSKTEQMISRLVSIFGNVVNGESVLQEFYTAEQRQDESTVDWGLRLENVLQRAIEKKHETGDKNEMLKSKFGRSLYNQDLKNATKMYKESIHDFKG